MDEQEPLFFHSGENEEGERITICGKLVDPSRGIFKVGIAKCRSKNFVKSWGRYISQNRMELSYEERDRRTQNREYFDQFYVSEYDDIDENPGKAFVKFCLHYCYLHNYEHDRSMKAKKQVYTQTHTWFYHQYDKTKAQRPDKLPF